MEAVYNKYFRDNLPHIWCPGCGNGIVMSAFARAMEKLGYSQDETMVVSGIGCSSRISGYLDFNTLHTAHGRALAFATGAKIAEPKMKMFVFMGDGDAAAIGGNHLIHACRRNIDMTAIVINNHIYGMTGGQFSPLTPKGAKATTAPYGNVDREFDFVELVKGAGATYVARGDIFHARTLTNLIVEAAQHKGFSVVEVISTCPISYGRYNQTPDPAEMVKYIKEHTISIPKAKELAGESQQGDYSYLNGRFVNVDKLKGMYVVGRHFVDDSVPEYCDEMEAMIERLKGGAE